MSMPETQRHRVSVVARAAIGGVLAYSGITKLLDIDGTIRAVRAYRLLPESVVPAFGSALPLLELALAVLLLAGLITRLAAGAGALLFLMFLFGVSSAWIRGLSIECGCFGGGGYTADPVPGYVRELVLDTLLLVACAWLVARPRSSYSLDAVLGLAPAAGAESPTPPAGTSVPDRRPGVKQ